MNYMIGSAATAAVSSMVAFLIYKWRTRIDLEAKKETAGIELDTRTKEQALALQAKTEQILMAELSKREAELSELRAQDRAERAQYVETLTAMKTALESIASDMRSQREEARTSASHVDQRLDTLDDRLLVIETRLQKPS